MSDTQQKIRAWFDQYTEQHKNWYSGTVFEFLPDVPEGQVVVQDRDGFDDGRFRVYINSKWESLVEGFIQEGTGA